MGHVKSDHMMGSDQVVNAVDGGAAREYEMSHYRIFVSTKFRHTQN